MTDRHAGYVVVLEQDIRDDDAKNIIRAMKMIKGVQDVTPVIATPDVHIAELRAAWRIRDRVSEALRDACTP